jgi:hypothetical protein
MQEAAPSGSGRARAFAPRPRAARPGAARNAASIGNPASQAAAERASTCPRNAASPGNRRARHSALFSATFWEKVGGAQNGRAQSYLVKPEPKATIRVPIIHAVVF